MLVEDDSLSSGSYFASEDAWSSGSYRSRNRSSSYSDTRTYGTRDAADSYSMRDAAGAYSTRDAASTNDTYGSNGTYDAYDGYNSGASYAPATLRGTSVSSKPSFVEFLKEKFAYILDALSVVPTLTWAIAAGILVLLLAIVIGIGVAISGSGSGAPGDDALNASDNAAGGAAVSAGRGSYTLSPSDFSKLSADASISGFSLSGGTAPEVSEDHAQAITNALSEITKADAEAGFILVDVDTGQGFSYNADHEVYGASSFKGPFATYVCEHFIETDEASLTDYIQGIGENDWGYVAAGEYEVGELIQYSIVDSDNGSFGALREYFSGNTTSGITVEENSDTATKMKEAFRTWLGGLGADTSIADDEEWFPFYKVRDAARFWTSIYNYLDTNTETAQFLSEMLSETDTSFLRDATKSTGATVVDKAGWYADDPTEASEYNSICDNGIVTIDGRSYLVCIMTSLCYDEDNGDNVKAFESLASAVFDARSDL